MINQHKQEWRMNYGGKEIVLEIGRMAKQADGSVLVSSQGTQVLVTVCSATHAKEGQDFFPLLVEYTEKFYAAGKYPGGFKKREGRPSDRESLNARLIDRPLRPLFPEGYLFDTVVSCTVFSYNPQGGDPEILAGLGASAALTVSDIPFAGPIGLCKVGRIDNKYILNPTLNDWKKSDMEIVVAASQEAILMVEGEAKLVPEKDVLEAIWFAHDNIKEYVALLKNIRQEVGRSKREFVPLSPNETLMTTIRQRYLGKAKETLSITNKIERQKAQGEIIKTVAKEMEQNPDNFGLEEGDSFSKKAAEGMDEILYNLLREDILERDKRIGDRGLNQVRPIETEVDVLSVPHGSALFTRGETQVLSTVTLGGPTDEQMFDGIRGVGTEQFYLHYNFPPYSVGESRGVRGVGRREIGHGNLAQRGVAGVLPHENPYTTRVVCEVLESNGSSSMGSVCAASMALMDAGIPLTAPVAGIAMGLVTDKKQFKILTDILGDEDHLGDMDFKVAGTEDGISAIQMDIKIEGLTREILEIAMNKAREGRLHILTEMAKTISTNRKEFKDNVPKIQSMSIPEDKIGALIGSGGKNIRSLQESFELTIDIEETGNLKIIGTDSKKITACMELIDLQINGPKIGDDYDAVAVTIKEYGAFVDIAPGVSGLVHISELANERIKDPFEYIAEGDKLKVKVLEVDHLGRLKLSAKAVSPLKRKKKQQ